MKNSSSHNINYVTSFDDNEYRGWKAVICGEVAGRRKGVDLAKGDRN